MKRKIVKIIFILLLVVSFSINFTFATDTDVDLNLPGTSDSSLIIPDSNADNSNSEGYNNNDENLSDVPAHDMEETIPDDDIYAENAEALNPSGVSTSIESELGITNIINILLITVGVILILLAIAIIIRLKS